MTAFPRQTPRDPATSIDGLRRDLARLAALPPGAPEGLPGRFYTDEDWFRHETATVLKDGWHCLGRADALPADGDYLTAMLLGEPILLVREQGRIRALSNVCRHRGMPLVEGTGNARRFVCPYHAWTYGLDGTLLRAARMENTGFDARTCRLPEFPCEERFGFVYISLAEQPVPLDDHLSGLEALIGPYQPGRYTLFHSASEIWLTNWKSLVENFMEGYHLSVVHPVTLHGYTPTGLSKKAASGRGFTSYFANYPQDIPARGTGAPGLEPSQRHRSTLFAVYPAQVVSVAASLLVSLTLRPVSAGAVEVHWTMSAYGDDLDAATRAERIRLWEEVNREDREKLESMQRALGSVHATGGPLAGPDYEGTVHDFLLWLAASDAGRLDAGHREAG